MFVARIELNLRQVNIQMKGGIYVAATIEAIHNTANTTSFFHFGQLRGSLGSDVGYGRVILFPRGVTVGIRMIW